MNGVPTGVMVDDNLCFNNKGDNLKLANIKNDKIWVAILEKAFAKLFGSYFRIYNYENNGYTPTVDPFHFLTGAACNWHTLK